MSVLVTGSVAVDHIMVFEDHFKNHFVADKLDKLNVAFHVPSMAKKYGGTGANIAYNLCRLGLDPILLGLVVFIYAILGVNLFTYVQQGENLADDRWREDARVAQPPPPNGNHP